jgi:signal transduction histidine kinase
MAPRHVGAIHPCFFILWLSVPSGMTNTMPRSSLDSDAVSHTTRTWVVEMAVIFAVWGLFTALLVGRSYLDPDRNLRAEEAQYMQLLARVSVYAVWALLTPAIFWLCSHAGTGTSAVPLWRRVLWHVGAAIGVAVVMDTYSDIIYQYGLQLGDDPPQTVWASLQGSVQDAVTLGFIYELIIYGAILAVGFARAYYRRLQQRQMQATQLRAQLTEARLQALRMQINPHFLFNTLNTVSGLVERNPTGARTMLARLSGLLRHTLSDDGQQLVPLADELSMLDDYLDIMRIRFEDRLQVEMRVDDTVRDACVPDLIMQPLVENAIKHGIRPRETPGCIRIGAKRARDRLVLRVEDDGPGVGGDGLPSSSGGIGLSNVRERLRQLYGDDHDVSLHSAPEGGLVVTLQIPYRTDATAPVSSTDESPASAAHA